MKEISCCFTGHRKIVTTDIIKFRKVVKNEIIALINRGVTHFLCGGALGFDMLCAEIVLSLKKSCQDIFLDLVLPCLDQAKFFPPEQKQRYENILSLADSITYTSEVYKSGCMHIRNRYMVDNSSFIVAHCKKQSGGSFYTLSYAKQKGVIVISV